MSGPGVTGAPVDVLAVMDELIQFAKDEGEAYPRDDDARAAVAELIEADKRIVLRAKKKAGGGFWMVSNEDMAAMRAALARVGGAK